MARKKPNFYNKWKDTIKDVRKFVKNRVAWIQEFSGNGYIYYGVNDSLPNEIIEALNNSGTATACTNKLKQFIVADGFKDENTGNYKINKHQTFDGLLGDIVENESKLEGFALQLFFNKSGQIAQIKNVPITWLRRKDDDTFVMNRLMGEYGVNRGEDVYIKEFDPTEEPSQRLARILEETKKNKGVQIGELFYCFRKKLGRNYDEYPVPSFYSGIDDIISDGKISTLELRNIQQGWRTPIVISTGHIDNENSIKDANGDDTGLTQLDLFNENIENFLGEDAAPVLHLQGRTPEEMPKVTTIDIKEVVDMTDKATVRVGEKVCRLMGVPKVLVGFAQAGQLGNVQELKNMMDLFYISIINRQNWITEKLNELKQFMFNGEMFDFEISKLNALTLIPNTVVARLSDVELRQIFEVPEVEGADIAQTTDIEGEQAVNSTLTNLTGRQLQNVQRIVRKFNKDDLTFEQAAALLKNGFGFTDEEVDVWLVTKEEEDGDNNPS